MQDPKQSVPFREEELDLGVFLTVFYKIAQKIAAFIKYIFVSLFNIVIGIFLILKKNWVFFLITAFIGLSIAFSVYHSKGSQYYSDMTVKTSFGSSQLLYQKINYFNALIDEEQTLELSKIFQISVKEAAKLLFFEINPVNDPLESARLYKTTFLTSPKNSLLWADTNWARTFQYKDFESKWQNYDFPLHNIRLYSRSAIIDSNIQKGIVDLINNNAALQFEKRTTLDLLQKEEELITNSLKGIDTLRTAYIKKIMQQNQEPEKNSIILTDRTIRSPEIELFDKEIMLKNELHDVKERQADLTEILKVYVDMNSVGTKRPVFIRIFLNYTLIALATGFFTVLIVMFTRYLNSFEKKYKKKY